MEANSGHIYQFLLLIPRNNLRSGLPLHIQQELLAKAIQYHQACTPNHVSIDIVLVSGLPNQQDALSHLAH